MAKYKVGFDRSVCIGAMSCNVVSPEFWLRADDGKVDLNGAAFNPKTKRWELAVDEEGFQPNKEAADACPVGAITITKIMDENNGAGS